VTAKVGNKITCTKINRSGRTQRTDTDAPAAGRQVRFYPTVLAFDNSVQTVLGDGLLYAPNGIGTLRNICFDGGFYVLSIDSGSLVDVQVMGTATPTPPSPHARRAVTIGNGYVGFGGEVVISDCDFGVLGFGVLGAFTGTTYITGCDYGVLPSGSGFTLGAITNGQTGVLVYYAACLVAIKASQSGNFNGGQFFMWGNGTGV
jgi:hypothetical protein